MAADSLPVLGDFLALLSAVFYALYVIFLKVRVREESRIDMQLFFGFVGLFNIFLAWPMGVILHFTGVERFEIPHTRNAIVIIALNVSSEFLCLSRWFKCFRWLSPYQVISYTLLQCSRLHLWW